MTAMSKYSDRELIGLFKEGNHTAYTEIYTRYSGILYLHAYNKLRNREEVKDILQELFATLWNNREQLQAETNLSGYLYQAIQNRIIKLYAYKKVRTNYVDALKKIAEISENGNNSTDHLLRERQLAEIIEEEISALPEKMREVFILSRRNHMTHKMIADHLGIAETTVRAHVHHALRILRGKLTLAVFILLWMK
jgi:RNA polymerase sigma-70 factor (family 1)